ncbi:hypothetical protein [Sutcliffiella cohnii]|uniref:hypothetical protein n=1 Tax=Sutcliffiella cohnii TaxID=33932 RepID=UPI002E1E7FBE|nr:hypothetical protein [Sutcliffiella cohnii]
MKISYMFFLFIVVCSILSGCNKEELTETGLVAKEYLDEKGYKILSYEQQVESYLLTESKLKQSPYDFEWNVPGNNPDPYFNKTVYVERFIVKGHPLDNWESNGVKSKGKVYVHVFVVDGAVVGGTSYPDIPARHGMVGGWYSLDGES